MVLLQNNVKKILYNYNIYLKNLFPDIISYIIYGELVIKTKAQNITKLLKFLKNHTNSRYQILSDLCAVDFPQKKRRFEIVYNLLSIDFNSRITVIITATENNPVESCSEIYKVAGWFEREILDLFGIFFLNHKDLRRILTDYGFKGHPLRKDFPLTGFTEVRYFDTEKRVILEEVSLAQDYRTFYFDNTWNTTSID